MKEEWAAEISPLASPAQGICIALQRGERSLRFGELFELLATSSRFTDWYCSILRDSDYSAFYWEHPPLTAANLADPVEFVLLAAPALESLRPDPSAFSEHFRAAALGDGTTTVIRFSNTGGDALLIVPCPDNHIQQHTHLAAFLRAAPAQQIRVFWRLTAETVLENLGTKPLWLSTSGLGVAWLHVRLDSRPKYYQHRPYKTPVC